MIKMVGITNVLFLVIWCIPVNGHYTLYHSDVRPGSYRTFDCLYAYLVDEGKENGRSYLRNSHLIPYCRRPDDENAEEDDQFIYSINKKITFKELREQNVSSEELLRWFAPIDIAEKYQMKGNDRDVYYNCSSPWFGSMCEYKLAYNLSLSFADIVQMTFIDRKEISSTRTCYKFVRNCNDKSWPLCLDWREICDGKMSCQNGEDEEWCDQLEMNECNGNEYRCHNGGQCIPFSFVKDSRLSIDCLDGSDEIDIGNHLSLLRNKYCSSVWTFRCGERTPRYDQLFSCGDGQYLTIGNMPFPSSYCTNKRDKELSRIMFTSLTHISNVICRQWFYCALHFNRSSVNLNKIESFVVIDHIWEKICQSLSNDCPSEWLVIPEEPILFGFFQFIYFTNRSINEFKRDIRPDLICFDAKKCRSLASDIVSTNIIPGLTCSHRSHFIKSSEMIDFHELIVYFYPISQQCLRLGIDKSCPNSSYFHCRKSFKCLLYHRVGDGKIDCFYAEDELFDACQLNDSNRFVCKSEPMKCLMPVALGNGIIECTSGEDEILTYTENLNRLVPFTVLCDYQLDYLTFLGISNDTDETNCHLWPCDNPYTQCNAFWDCPNGMDELNCPNAKCSFNEYECAVEQFNFSYCLSREHIYEKYISNCNNSLGYSRQLYFFNETNNRTKDYFSWNNNKCISEDKLCKDRHHSQMFLEQTNECLYRPRESFLWAIEDLKFIQKEQKQCKLDFAEQSSVVHYGSIVSTPFFRVNRLGFLPIISKNISFSTIHKPNSNKTITSNIDKLFLSYCNDGILLFSGLNQTKTCLCPPSYFGSRCQWQNQRISLTIQLQWQSTLSTMIIFEVMIMLIDQDGEITSSNEQVTYMPSRDCDTKFNLYLLYPQRPKSSSKNYSIRIDLYEKIQLIYWSSWHLSIPFQFLPVNRIATQLIIPQTAVESERCLLSCGKHGKCIPYTNDKSFFFCQCNEGYSGSRCENQHQCHCQKNSFCLHSSICICPLQKFGSFCHLTRSICHSSKNNPCENNGFCVPTDDRIDLKGFTCSCPEDYSGARCQNKNNRIDIHFDRTILSKTSLLLIHLITAFENAEHERITELKRIPYNQKSLTIYAKQPFHILLIQIFEDYYLTVLREEFLPSEHIQTEVSSKSRCFPIDELLNETFRDSEYLRRVKSYPLLCREDSELKCFYDEDFICICDLHRFSNCFIFNHTRNNDCQGLNYCENGGQCFQNNQTCPTKFTCICQDCFYGGKCQFSTKDFLFSLDSILGYHIKPNIALTEQPLIIKISITISTILLILGSINGIFSILTFRQTKPRQVGTGYYLLFSSIISILIIHLLTIKFWLLVFSQMSLITNRSFLYINCVSLDFTLRIILSSSEWLNACVAIERMFTVIQKSRFDKKKSEQVSKWIILMIILMTILTHLHDPIHRELIDDFDIDQHRIWCVVKYSSSSLNIYNSMISLFHFLIPFAMNIISALWIIISLTYHRHHIQSNQSLKEHFKEQIQQHRHILFSPCLLILLALPRLIISFVSGCIRSSNEPWLFLMGYFLSFMPSMLTFLIFVLPSTNYKTEFTIVVQRITRRFRSNF